MEKETIERTIKAISDQVTSKRDELEKVAKETRDLHAKVSERRRRNEEHHRVLERRREAVTAQLKAIESKEEGIKQRLSAFHESREASRKQLQEAIKSVENSQKDERRAHESTLQQIRSKIGETKATMEAEAKSLALETALRTWNEKCDARKLLMEELASAESGKDVWADILRECNSLQADDSLATLDGIVMSLAAYA